MNTVNDKQKRLRALQRDTDRSLQQLINEAYLILENPIMLYDLDKKLLAHVTDDDTATPTWNEYIKYGTINDEHTALCMQEGIYDALTKTDKVIFVNSNCFKHPWLIGKVYDRIGLPIALINVMASKKPFEDNTAVIVEAICKVLSKSICKISYYQSFSQMKLDAIIKELIDGTVKKIDTKTSRIEMIYKGLKENIYCAVVDISQCDPTHTKLVYYRDLFKRTRPAFKYSIYSNYIVIIMSTAAEEIFYPKRCFNRLNRLFEQDNMYIGISSRFENLYELLRHYDEAVKTLSDGLKSDGNQRIFVYEGKNSN